MSEQVKKEQIALLIGCPDLKEVFKKIGIKTKTCSSPEQAISKRLSHDVRITVIFKEAFTNGNIINNLRNLRKQSPFTDILVWAPGGPAKLTRDALKGGAYDVFLKKSQLGLVETVREIIQSQKILPKMMQFRKAQTQGSSFQGMMSRSPIMWDIFEQCLRVAPTEASVLIQGETGTGKDLLARAIHKLSERNGKYIPVNCAAIPETLIDSELFGHKKGAFTGADIDKKGLFREAHLGTLFLDEIGDIPKGVQTRLLRTLQSETIRPVGSQKGEIPVDVRIVSASHVPLEEAVAQKRFREDLFFRLNVIKMIIPPLRERTEDILHLFGYFIKKFDKTKKNFTSKISDRFLDEMLKYSWPGNIRQLENFSQRLIVLFPKEKLTSKHFKLLMKSYKDKNLPTKQKKTTFINTASFQTSPQIDLKKTMAELTNPLIENTEKNYLEACLKANKGKIKETAKHAGISRRTLLRKLKQYHINKKLFKSIS